MKHVAWLPFLAAVALSRSSAIWAQEHDNGAVYRIEATSGATFVLPAPPGSGPDLFLGPDGTWRPLPAERREDGTRLIRLTPEHLGAGGATRVLLGKPQWMVAADVAPPEVICVRTGEGKRFPGTQPIDIGCVSARATEFTFELRDDLNPLDPGACTFVLGTDRNERIEPECLGLGPPGKTGTLTVRLGALAPGAYEATLTVCDLSPARNTASRSVAFSVFGISTADDGQSIRLATTETEYQLRADKLNHLLLPGGIWSRLTTNTDSTWLYPRRFTDVRMLEDTGDAKTVLVAADTQGIDGKPHEGLGALEFELTVHRDSPALFVTTRSRNISERQVVNYANWGWLPASYYVTPDGRHEWRGKAADQYFDIGHVGWLWLAPTAEGKPGLVWMSALQFGESRFDTMLLYSARASCKPSELVEMTFAIAPAASAEEARSLVDGLVTRGLITPPAAVPQAGE